ncbi:GNAT family N-acetyltransferase [Paenibacillus brasilensis]|uniref:Ribosomal protein S18 acetylase RimI-like enzyme n=1 Tax=Paenibacillus brasilensis TaxID=128574 RepID=A0ABU0KWJ8_9BACL|nr:GNAT family N-acetyltransferase [Paenibacillus brasilensis]MDQ0493813.1 ribosomal protein S18 acetylase RimI-like enzyme [Paenibacillus brasilensis]
MKISPQEFNVKGMTYTIRSATNKDARNLSKIRLLIDGETENLDREKGEAYIDTPGFEQLIETDTQSSRNLFLVAVVHDKIVGFSRCEGYALRRFAHKVEFGVCILKDYWDYGIGTNLLRTSISWADSNHIKKMTLQVLETNNKAIELYKKHGFEVEGILKNDKLLSDSRYYNTVIMGRFPK